MLRRIVLLLTVAALMALMVVAPASAQTINVSPTMSPTVNANDNLDDFANDNTVQCVGDPLVDLSPDSPSPIGGDDSGDQCADDGGSNEDNDSTDFPTVPTFP